MRFKKVTIYIFSLFVLLNLLIFSDTLKQKENIQNYFRIHVVANSNSIKDQKLKLKVASNIQKKIQTILEIEKPTTKEETKEIITENIQELLNVAKDTLTKEKQTYDISANIGNINYDKKQKENIQMAKGTYDSVRFVIGEGKGENFWSLLYPNSLVGTYEIVVYDENVINTKDITINDMIEDTDTTYSSFIYEWFIQMFKD